MKRKRSRRSRHNPHRLHAEGQGIFGERHRLYRFHNNWGASVKRTSLRPSTHPYELAVLHGGHMERYSGLTGGEDVVFGLSEAQVQAMLRRIKALPLQHAPRNRWKALLRTLRASPKSHRQRVVRAGGRAFYEMMRRQWETGAPIPENVVFNPRRRRRRSRHKNPSSALVLREAVDLADWSKPFYRLPIVFRGSLGECIAYARSRGCQWRRHADLLYGGYWEGAQTGLSLIPDTPGNVVTPPLGSRRGPPVRRNPRRRRCRSRRKNPCLPCLLLNPRGRKRGRRRR